MERANKYVLHVTPQQAHVEHQTTAPVIGLKLGERGFYPIHTPLDVEYLNGEAVSPEVIESAVIGSMFGWDVPGAIPALQGFERDGATLANRPVEG
jgi:hypothetical protein